MNIGNVILIGIGVSVILAVGSYYAYRKVPRKLKSDVFADRWKSLQVYCKSKDTWPQALEEADKLLDEALKKRKYRGKTMGERMVSAQKVITNNDAMWFAHNLYKKTHEATTVKLKETEVKMALIGFRGALKDIGALEVQKPTEQVDGDKTS